ncbi:hypothetical protein [Pedobacter gandavensis]|uniref:Uncharacterized protein n=1 Tax=Pedobacter gandavensis TaxID=2679963 RepID=A0ABR6F1X0_9SPHI|nr:hypothetical protein [Pedobacter gandavensis]MBB2151495.1 hypothetical protein [Pedobacter gandavensis]
MKIQGVIGAAVMAAGGLCPLMRLPIIGNWNYFDIDPRLATAFYVLVVLALLGSFTNKVGLIKFSGWAVMALVAISLAGIYFKVHDSFGFLHFKKMVNLAAGMVKLKWGWFVIVVGAGILITVRRPKVVLVPSATPEVGV